VAKQIERVEYLVVHCSASPADMDIGKAEIRKWHLQRGFADIGYHFVIRRDGTLEFGRPTTESGAHAVGYNLHSLGICLVGGLKKGTTKAENNFTPAQFERLWSLLGELGQKYPDAEVLGHRDLPGVNKACPSFDVRSWMKERARVCP
jgi:N-acetylmuramoyl-L-alanine amidase